MSRLPIPGSDDGQWGQILNDYLAVTHAGDGSLKDSIISLATLSQEVKDEVNSKVSGQNGATTLWIGTQTAYDAISSKSATTLYVISGS